jgi:salicylate synthase
MDTMEKPPHAVALPGSEDGLAGLYDLVSAGMLGDYVSYARPRERWLAAGLEGEILIYRDRLAWRADGPVHEEPLAGPPLRQLGRLLCSWPLRRRTAFGYLAFELAHLVHGTGLPDGDRPLAHLIVPKVQVHWTPAQTLIHGRDPGLVEFAAEVLRSAGPLPRPRATEAELTSEPSRRWYEAAVAQVVAAIARGDLRKAIVSRRVELPFRLDLPASYVLGSALSAPTRSFLLDLGGRQVAGFSPETVAEVSADGIVCSRPLAGTRPLLNEPERDRQLREELIWDVKECYEHVISARLAQDELRSVCDPDSVRISGLLDVQRHGTVQHLGSLVSGRLAAGTEPWAAAEALWPAVTASGIPKPAALDLIRAIEGRERGIYAGAVCMAGADGSIDAALVLRSVFQDETGAWLQAGAGIVAGSAPASEYAETTSKLRAAARYLVPAPPASVPARPARARALEPEVQA